MKGAFLTGRHIFLRPLQESDADGNYPEWFNDQEVCKYNRHGRFPNTQEKTLEYTRTVDKSQDNLALAIIEKTNNKHIGNVALSKINLIDRNAELSIIIGEKEYWRKGYGKEACSLMINHAFNVLNLHRIASGTHEENIGFKKLAASLGMKEEGKYHENIFKNGKYSNTVWFYILNPNHK